MPETFGSRLRTLRRKRGLSIRQLEDISGIDRGGISLYENEKRQPTAKRALKLADALEVTVDSLLNDPEPRTPWTRFRSLLGG